MNRSLYFFTISFLGFSFACGLFQSILYLLLDAQVFSLESFTNWFLVMYIISLVGSLSMLKYYHYKKYWFAFSTGTIATVAILCQFLVLYIILVARELQSYYIPTLFLVIGAGLVYAISLIFSDAGKRPWLKAAGVFMLIMGLVFISAIIVSMLSQDAGLKDAMQKILKWTSVANSFVPLLLIMNLESEVRTLETENTTSNLQKFQESALSFVGLTAIVFALFFGVLVATQSHAILYWQNRNFENAQELAKQFEARTFANNKGDTMRYQFMKPLNYDPQKKYPLVVCLHHGGTHGTDNISQLGADPAPFLSNDMVRRNYPAFLFMPQCPKGMGWNSIDSLIFESISALEDEFEIDASRRYVAGVSGGGYGSWHFISARPEMFAAAIPICGGGDPKLAPNIVDVPVWAFHGEKDNLVPVRLSREMIDAIKNAGGNPRYTEFPNEGHNIWGKVSATPGLLEWLFAQKRDSLP